MIYNIFSANRDNKMLQKFPSKPRTLSFHYRKKLITAWVIRSETSLIVIYIIVILFDHWRQRCKYVDLINIKTSAGIGIFYKDLERKWLLLVTFGSYRIFTWFSKEIITNKKCYGTLNFNIKAN
jgi:hypothetical protein